MVKNCPDIRNSKVVDVIHELQSYGTLVDVYDPQADASEVEHEYKLKLVTKLDKSIMPLYLLLVMTTSKHSIGIRFRNEKQLFTMWRGFSINQSLQQDYSYEKNSGNRQGNYIGSPTTVELIQAGYEAVLIDNFILQRWLSDYRNEKDHRQK